VDEAYKEMAEAILMPSNDEADFTDQGSTTSTESGMDGNKRRRPESVIVGQLEQRAKKGRPGNERKPAGWLQGKADWGRGRHQAHKPYVGRHQTDHPPQRGRWSWPSYKNVNNSAFDDLCKCVLFFFSRSDSKYYGFSTTIVSKNVARKYNYPEFPGRTYILAHWV
jgi:hypothetical protein